MLDKQIDEIVMEGGAVVGVRSGSEVAKCKQVYCDPSYATGNVKKTGRVVRCICLLDHPIPNTKDALSTQLILPQKQRKTTLPCFGPKVFSNLEKKGHQYPKFGKKIK